MHIITPSYCVCLSICMHCMYVYIYVYMYVCTYVCMYVCMYACMYAGMCPQWSAVVGTDHHSDKIATTQIK